MDLSNRPYVSSGKDVLPAWMNNLNYDEYRDIRFNKNQALWSEGELPFRAMFFHPGYLYREPVVINEFAKQHLQQIRLSEAYFSYGKLVKSHGKLPADSGFAGFRLHAPLNMPKVYDELIAFQGASYWRALGRNQNYGISARGLAINTGLGDRQEEFPLFREFWLRKPDVNESSAQIYALLDSPSYSGAYSFKVSPGNDTIVDVRAVIYCRQSVKRLGIAPMSSMYWFGENSRHQFDDFRPEVHDSDGLAIRSGSGERIWRPLSNDSGKLEFSYFPMDKCDGFGLLQRDRNFSSYQDVEAYYDKRPSLWIEPTSNWGPGSVVLMEIPTKNEMVDNSVAMWQPERAYQPGDRIEFSYRQHWTKDIDPSQSEGYVVATRTGVHEREPEGRTIIVEFEGGNLRQEDASLIVADVQVIGENANQIKIIAVNVQKISEERFRASFQIIPALEGGRLIDYGTVELRGCLKAGEKYLTETWTYRIKL